MLPHAVERVAHLVLEAAADVVAVPEQAAEILHPLEVRDRDPAGVREYVREHRDPAPGEDRVRLQRGRAVRSLGDHPRLHARRVVTRDLVLERGEDEDVALQLEQLLVRDVLALVLDERGVAVLDGMVVQRLDVEAVGVVDPAGDIGEADHRRAAPGQLAGRYAADLPEALDDAALLGEVPAEPLASTIDDHHDARAGRLRPEDRAADRDRLAGDDLRDRIADLHRVRVHHPGHRLLVGRHVRRRDVLLGADDREQLGGEAAGDRLELPLRERARVAAHPALGAAVGQPKERALPRHPHRERRALAQRDVVVVADTALGRPQDARVLDSVAREDDAPVVVEPDRKSDDQRALGKPQSLRDRVGDLAVVERLLELGERRVEERVLPLERLVLRNLLQTRHGEGV